ncbi:alpha-glucosidase family protein (plasmid) [Roseivivax marinus]|uniref:alpha-glucosidase n=1 Tax=Roseivivax marinus TaxID=1379903 RepID=UPI001F04B82E|nr:alpha-glucosidase [Roseivivax marinus]UMA67117.1 alpha-glucosidase family protein [Roseivivax marinus]
MTSNDAWWRGAVIYHVYPRSFQDTSGDGIGDLNGITQRLGHIAELGADAVWISPFVRSPMRDFGYDVLDYCDVDPMFGTLEDFHRLLDTAHKRDLKVLMDQVLSHTSSDHPWFLESRASRDNAKADWYVWADPRPDGSPPNNWLSVFGGSAWQWEPRRSQYYLHNFLREQPDLNFHNPSVRAAVLDVCRFWLEMGVDGFRLDVCAFYFHDPELKDNPPNPNRPSGKSFMFNPYSMQRHVNDIGQPENLAFLEELRGLCDAYSAVLLGELHETDAEKLHREYTAPGRLHLAYGYWLLGAEEIGAGDLYGLVRALGHEAHEGWPAWALENHDFMRAPSRLADGEAPMALTAALISMRGAFCFYQGAELGLPEANVPFERLADPYGREFYPAYPGRDGSRTPIPWNADAPHSGFSEVEPWLPIPAEHRALNAEDQGRLAGSVLARMRRFLNWRRTRPELRDGNMDMLDLPEPVFGFVRAREEDRLLCLFNLGDGPVDVDPPQTGFGTPVEGHGLDWASHAGRVRLPRGGGYFGELA